MEFVTAVIKDQKPGNQIDAMCVAQLAVMHMANMQFLRKLADTRETDYSQQAVNMVSKLVKSFSDLAEVLRRRRNGSEQRITVQHVSVADGGQAAVVGHQVTQTPQPKIQESVDEAPALADLSSSAMPSLESERQSWLDYVERKKKSSSS